MLPLCYLCVTLVLPLCYLSVTFVLTPFAWLPLGLVVMIGCHVTTSLPPPPPQNEQVLKQQVTELEEERKADQERYQALEAETKAKVME